MQIQDCPWEIENIGKRTVQLNYTKEDIYDSEKIRKAVEGYQYLVAKVPTGNISCLLGLQSDGFKMIETQLSLSKRIKDFNFNDHLVRLVSKDLSYEIIENEKGLNRVLQAMTPNMFSTDRIYLDPKFGPETGLHRYRNWTKTEFHRGSILAEWKVGEKHIGFSLRRIKDRVSYGLLGGVYEKYQDEGYGMLTAAGNCLFPKLMGYDMKISRTAISSNNMPVLNFYNYLQFKIDKMEYVLIKHLS